MFMILIYVFKYFSSPLTLCNEVNLKEENTVYTGIYIFVYIYCTKRRKLFTRDGPMIGAVSRKVRDPA